MHDVHQLDRHTELVRDHLRKRCLVALAVAVRAGKHGDASGWVNTDFCRLVEAGACPKLTGRPAPTVPLLKPRYMSRSRCRAASPVARTPADASRTPNSPLPSAPFRA